MAQLNQGLLELKPSRIIDSAELDNGDHKTATSNKQQATSKNTQQETCNRKLSFTSCLPLVACRWFYVTVLPVDASRQS